MQPATNIQQLAPSRGLDAWLLGLSSSPKQVIQVHNPNASRLKRMRSRVLHAARHHAAPRTRPVMVTLTLRDDVSWSPKMIARYLHRARMYLHRRYRAPLRAVWVAELTRRGRMHYHILCWLPLRARLPKPDASGMWPHGCSSIEQARNAAGYLVKYVSKQGSKTGAYPRGARIYGVLGLDAEARRVQRYHDAPYDCRLTLGPAADIHRIRGGRYDRSTGAFWRTPYRALFHNGLVVIINTELLNDLSHHHD